MAQAVAARTYAVRYRGRREALGFDVYPTHADQVYTGVEAESPEVTDAVTRTAGQIVTFRGEPIQALFHSTCGWSTEAADAVFQNGAPVPYLRAVSDRTGRGSRDYYCAISPRFRWREEWDAATLTAIVAQTLPAVVGPRAATLGRVTDIRASRTSPTGRVAELTITTTDGEFVVPQGRIREVLRSASGGQLNSTMLQLHVERRGDSLVRVVAAGGGYGHGVGMCQFGAVGRARAGQDFRRILAAYYHDTTLERAY
jgi:stage II sporulation protein D